MRRALFVLLVLGCADPQPPPPPPPPAGGECIPAAEICDGADNDCDGVTDGPHLADAPGCGGMGVCAGGARPCEAGAFLECGGGDLPPSFEAGEQSCDDLDNDCDGATDGRCVWTVAPGTAIGRLADVARAPDGTIVVSDIDARRVLRLSADGASVTVLIGPNEVSMPGGLAVAPGGTIFVADVAGHRILALAPGGALRVVAGSGAAGFQDGASDAAKFHQPVGLALGADGTLFVADLSNHRIRAVAPDGTVRTVAGTGAAGYDDGATDLATFDSPRGVAVESNGALLVADTNNSAIRRITGGEVSTAAGGSGAGFADGPALSAQLDRPFDIAADARGAFVADAFNHAVRWLAAGRLTTLAGNGQAGGRDGLGPVARFSLPGGLAAGEGFDLLVADPGNAALRGVRP